MACSWANFTFAFTLMFKFITVMILVTFSQMEIMIGRSSELLAILLNSYVPVSICKTTQSIICFSVEPKGQFSYSPEYVIGIYSTPKTIYFKI
jgi:hypothetical protein